MELTFLGTSCMVPTKERNVAGTFLSYKNEGILFDCGEGTQRQMNITGIKRSAVTKILVTHWHGDHVSGLIGLIQTLSNQERPPTIEVYGPKGTNERIGHMLKAVVFENKVDLRTKELSPKTTEKFYENKDFCLECARMNHSTPCLAYAFIEKDKLNIDKLKLKKYGIKEGPYLAKLKEGETINYEGKEITPEMVTNPIKGRKICYITDTRPNANCHKLAHDSDILICDGTFTHELIEKAEKYNHLTAREAAQIASQSNAKALYLTHFSQRYKSTQEIEDDARNVFDKSYCAKDFMKINL